MLHLHPQRKGLVCAQACLSVVLSAPRLLPHCKHVPWRQLSPATASSTKLPPLVRQDNGALVYLWLEHTPASYVPPRPLSPHVQARVPRSTLQQLTHSHTLTADRLHGWTAPRNMHTTAFLKHAPLRTTDATPGHNRVPEAGACFPASISCGPFTRSSHPVTGAKSDSGGQNSPAAPCSTPLSSVCTVVAAARQQSCAHADVRPKAVLQRGSGL